MQSKYLIGMPVNTDRQKEEGTGNTSYMGDGWRKPELTGVTICHHFAPRKKNKKGERATSRCVAPPKCGDSVTLDGFAYQG